jgi:ribosomal protein L40E
MDLAEGIRKKGFRGWYERQLIEAHLFLISGFLCLIMVIASLEGFSLHTPVWETLLRFFAMLLGSALCLWALKHYLVMLDYAEYAAEHSVCEKCTAYGGLDPGSATTHRAGRQDEDEDGEETAAPVSVRCRKCGYQWTIG